MQASLYKLACDVLGISIAAIIGVLTRVGLNTFFIGIDITSRDGPIFFDMPANIFGCFVLGFISAPSIKPKINLSVYLSLSTGYAGSVTTFASWNYQTIRMFMLGKQVDSVLALFLGICVALLAFIVGQDSAAATECLIQRIVRQRNNHVEDHPFPDINSGTPSQQTGMIRDKVIVLVLLLTSFILLWGTCVGVTIISFQEHRLPLTSFFESASVASVGALLRWRLSKLNSRFGNFPLGTFIANVSAVLFDVCIGLVSLAVDSSNQILIASLNSLITGLAGSLSTTSTWISEMITLHRLNKNASYFYVAATILVSQLVGLAIYGPTYRYLKGLDNIAVS